MKQRIITGALLIAAIVPPIYFGGVYLQILLGVFVIAVVYEFIKVTNDQEIWSIFGLLVAYIFFNLFINDQWFIETTSLLIILLFTINVFNVNYDVMKISYLFMFAVFILLALRSFNDLYAINVLVIVYLLLITYLTDTFAYFGGMLFGKHKLNERISPKKTIEGAICGYLGGVLIGLIFGLIFLSLPKTLIIVSSLIIPIFSQIGDLAMSSVKRHFDCKDFSNILPGHGGVLDRIDSLTFSLLILNILVRLIS